MSDGLLLRWYMDPLFKGHYPADVLEHLGDDQPLVSAGDLKEIMTPIDFLGINYYTRSLVSSQPDFGLELEDELRSEEHTSELQSH